LPGTLKYDAYVKGIGVIFIAIYLLADLLILIVIPVLITLTAADFFIKQISQAVIFIGMSWIAPKSCCFSQAVEGIIAVVIVE
jgi:hypothetical protein